MLPKGIASALVTVAATFGGAAQAQRAAPITITPQTAAPEHVDNGFRVDIPVAGALQPPVGAKNLSVTLRDVTVEGGFAELEVETAASTARLKGHRVTLKDIYAAASEIEAMHARAGFVLARVAVPSQDLRDGGTLRITITDGFIESVDVTGVPERVQSAVQRRAEGLQGKRHLKLAQIEEPLLIANDVPGLTLRSTLSRGSQQGGTKLVLEGTHKLLTGSVGGGNGYDPSLGTYGFNAQIALNSPLGLGEQIYGFYAGGYDPGKWFKSEDPVRVLGAGVVLPVGNGALTFNPEAILSRTRPAPPIGAPQTLGTLRRLSLRANYTLRQTRQYRSGLSFTVEHIDEKNEIPSFAFLISHDRYTVARLGASVAASLPSGASWGFGAQVSKGLGQFGAIGLAERLASGVPFSRQGAGLDFTKLDAHFTGALPLGNAANLRLHVLAQTSFGAPLLRSEQFSLEGSDAVSAYVGGATAVDSGVTARAELSAGNIVRCGKARLIPYAFVAGGTGKIEAPTVLEPGTITAGSAGAGLRLSLGTRGHSFGLEYARGFSSYTPLSRLDRVNFSAVFRI